MEFIQKKPKGLFHLFFKKPTELNYHCSQQPGNEGGFPASGRQAEVGIQQICVHSPRTAAADGALATIID
jgi:hypothetical protein